MWSRRSAYWTRYTQYDGDGTPAILLRTPARRKEARDARFRHQGRRSMNAPDRDLADAHRKVLWTPYYQMKTALDQGPIIFERGEGVYLYDSTGKRYLDGNASLWLMNVGMGRREIADAVFEQMQKMPFFSMFQGFSNPPAIELAELLIELTKAEGMGKVFYWDSGAEAVEPALKIPRQYWRNRGRVGKYKFIGRHSAYHGVTFGALSATGITANRRMFEPLVPGFRHIADPNFYPNDFGTGLSEEDVAVAASD